MQSKHYKALQSTTRYIDMLSIGKRNVCEKTYFVNIKAKGQISKWVFQENKARPNFSKNERFLPPDTHTRG